MSEKYELVVDKDDRIRRCHCSALVEALEGLVRACTTQPLPSDGGAVYGVRIPEREIVDAARAVLKRVRGES